MTSVLKDRAASARLAIAELDEQSKNEAEQAAIATARARAQTAAEAIAEALAVRATLAARPISVSPIGPARRKDAREGRTGLRRAATQLADPDRQLTGLLNGQSVQAALKQAEDVAKALASAVQSAVEQRRRELRPEGLDDPVPDLPGQPSVALKLRLAKARLEVSVLGVALIDLPKRLDDIEVAAETWQELRPMVDAHIAALPDDIQCFLQAAAAEDGAPWALVTPEVRAWLDESSRGEPYRVHLG